MMEEALTLYCYSGCDMNPEKIGLPAQPIAPARAWSRMAALALVVALLLLGEVTLGARPAYASGDCAQVSAPCIEFLYPNANQPIIGGPASTAVEIMGSGFTGAENKTISFGLIKGDDILGQSPSPTFCEQPHINVPGSTQVSSTGTFSTVTIYWPTGTSVGDWSVCAYLAGTNKPATGTSNTDSLAWPVSSPYRPTVSVSPSYLASSGVVTVTGHGWLPAQNGINLYILPCAACTTYIAYYGNAISSGSGVFSVQLTIPASVAHGKYLVRAMGTVIQDSSSESGPYLWIGVLPTPTPRPTPKPTPTPRATPTPKPTATATTTPVPTITPFVAATATPAVVVVAESNNPLGGSGGWLYLGLGALVVVLIGGGILGYALIRRRAAHP